MELLAWGVPKLSRGGCARLADVLGSVAYRVDARGRKVALENLNCVWPALTREEHEAMARASYQNFLRTMLDLFWAPNLTAENWTRWLEMEGIEAFRQTLGRKPSGTIMMCVHQGNWEWASLAFGFLGFPTTIVAENFKNPHLTEIFSRLRQVSGHKIIAQENSILRMLKLVKRGGATGLLIDLSLPPTQAATVIDAFAQESKAEEASKVEGRRSKVSKLPPLSRPPTLQMCVPLLHAVLAQRAGALLLPVSSESLPDGRCRVKLHPPVELPPEATLQEIAQHCWDALEPVVRTRPELWLWPYKHFRYRPRNATRDYPEYANESGKFEKLRKPPKPANLDKPSADGSP